MKTYRVCKECSIHHYENCDTCLGFGIKAVATVDGFIPITAGQAHENELPEWVPCPECMSTPKGIPEGVAP